MTRLLITLVEHQLRVLICGMSPIPCYSQVKRLRRNTMRAAVLQVSQTQQSAISDGTRKLLNSTTKGGYELPSLSKDDLHEDSGFFDACLQNESHKPMGPEVKTSSPQLISNKAKRQRSTVQKTGYECRVCGKLFGRACHLKSHTKTHNPEKKYPHVCTAMIGQLSCDQKFQRKRDLDRHYEQVSIHHGTKVIHSKT